MAASLAAPQLCPGYRQRVDWYAGMAHLPPLASTVDMFLRVLAELRTRHAAAAYEPARVNRGRCVGTSARQGSHIADEPLVALLPDLLAGEPSTWHGSGGTDADGWIHKPSTWLRRFDDVHDIGDYLARCARGSCRRRRRQSPCCPRR